MPSLLSNLQRDSQVIYGRTFEDDYEMPPNVYAEEVYSAEYQVTRREPWHECKALIAGVRAAGSWKAFDRVPRKAVIRLRSLYTRGRATTADPIMKFICELGDNGVVWNVLSFWRGGRARLY